jgi:uncharacterized protein YbjT (DUF2867 family)
MSPESRVALVVGVTGQQGGAVVDQLLADDEAFEVHGLTRNPDSRAATELVDGGMTVVQGDLDDRDSLDRAMAGVDLVFGVTDFWEHSYEGQVRQGRHLVDAATEAGVDHVVFSSVAGADRATGVAPFESAREIERYLDQRAVPDTVIRPVWFMQNLEHQRDRIRDGTLALPIAEGVDHHLVDVTDIGRATRAVFERPEPFRDDRIKLAGDRMTPTEMADVLSGMVGTEVQYHPVPIEDAREKMGDAYADMFAWFNEDEYDVDVDALGSRLGFDLTSFEQFLAANDWGI